MSDYCYCDHDVTDHENEDGRCLAQGCDCLAFESVDDDDDDEIDEDDDEDGDDDDAEYHDPEDDD